jgi:hypothetical protein
MLSVLQKKLGGNRNDNIPLKTEAPIKVSPILGQPKIRGEPCAQGCAGANCLDAILADCTLPSCDVAADRIPDDTVNGIVLCRRDGQQAAISVQIYVQM